MKPIIFFMLLTLLSVPVLKAQDSTYQAVVEKFFTLYKDSGPEKAIDFIFSTNPYLDPSSEQVSTIKLKLTTAVAVIGDYYGYDAVVVKELGPSFTIGTYMLRYKRQPLFFTFVMYKPDRYWQIQTLRFDDKTDQLDMTDFPNVAGEDKP